MRVGVLALQGAFAEHRRKVENLGAQSFEIRGKKDLDRQMDGVILPGGESMVIGKLLRDLEMAGKLRTMILNGLPAFGTCAGLILMAQRIKGESAYLATMDITARRNAYGRQLGSFWTEESFGEEGKIPMTFIRAPYIEEAGNKVMVLASTGGKITAARQDNQLVKSFHPELDDDDTVHRYFLDMIKEAYQSTSRLCCIIISLKALREETGSGLYRWF